MKKIQIYGKNCNQKGEIIHIKSFSATEPTNCYVEAHRREAFEFFVPVGEIYFSRFLNYTEPRKPAEIFFVRIYETLDVG